MGAVAAALVPGMPQLLAADPAPSWRELASGARTVGDRLRAEGVEAVLLLSTQWFTVPVSTGKPAYRVRRACSPAASIASAQACASPASTARS